MREPWSDSGEERLYCERVEKLRVYLTECTGQLCGSRSGDSGGHFKMRFFFSFQLMAIILTRSRCTIWANEEVYPFHSEE